MTSVACSRTSRDSGEPLYGTCGSFDYWVFVSRPISTWHPTSALQSQGMPPELAAWLGEKLSQKLKISFRTFDDPRVTDGTVKLKLYPDAQETVVASPSDIVVALEKRLNSDKAGWEDIKEKEFFICTDPGHDACCTRYGPPVFAAASELIRTLELPIKVFRCSHLGGHKFAATGITFPQGHMYGRMDEENVRLILEDVMSDNIHAPNYRGTITYSKDEQAATYVAASRGWLEGPIKRIRVLEIVEEAERRHLHAEVIGALPFTVTLVKKKFLSPGSCGHASEEKKFTENWVVSEIDGQTV